MAPRGKKKGARPTSPPPSAAKYLRTPDEAESAGNRHAFYQRAVQRPKGDISYLVKFFLTYVGGRVPLHLREDFCGTALLCAEWLRGDARRTAVGLDLDSDALRWGLHHNLTKLPGGAQGRLALLHGNVLRPIGEARRVGPGGEGGRGEGEGDGEREEWEGRGEGDEGGEGDEADSEAEEQRGERGERESRERREGGAGVDRKEREEGEEEEVRSKGADIVCAFNFSTCCLHTREELRRYLGGVREGVSREGGVVAVDLYGGTSSECALKIKRTVEDFTYTWEQEAFDAVRRMTRIALHFRPSQGTRTLRKAFAYDWRLWTIPEVKECMEEVGFREVHVWIREMPDLGGRVSEEEELEADPRALYQEVERFPQCDAWGAYIVGVV